MMRIYLWTGFVMMRLLPLHTVCYDWFLPLDRICYVVLFCCCFFVFCFFKSRQVLSCSFYLKTGFGM